MALGMRYSSLDNEQWTNQINEFATNLNSSKQNMLMGSDGSILNGELLRKQVAGNGKQAISRWLGSWEELDGDGLL